LVILEKLPAKDRIALLPTLGRVGGALARETLSAALREPASYDMAFKGLCNWPDATIDDQLHELVVQAKTPEQGIAALRALIRVAVLADDRTDTKRLALLQSSLKLCSRDAERQLVLKRAQAIRTIESLRFVVEHLDQPTLVAQACESIVELAHHRALRDAHRDEFHAALDRVRELSKDEILRERAQRYKEGKTWTGKGPHNNELPN
jgi:hypothetical protein